MLLSQHTMPPALLYGNTLGHNTVLFQTYALASPTDDPGGGACSVYGSESMAFLTETFLEVRRRIILIRGFDFCSEWAGG